jgi:hypothetical protein
MDPDAPRQGSQEATAGKAVELNKDAASRRYCRSLLAQKAGIPSLATSLGGFV